MAFLNGKYTAFDPHITLTDVVDDENNFVVHGELDTSAGIYFYNCDKTVSEIDQAIADGKKIWFFYQFE